MRGPEGEEKRLGFYPSISCGIESGFVSAGVNVEVMIGGKISAENQLISARIDDKTLVLIIHNPLTVSRKSIYEPVSVLGSPHPHPNPVKGAFFSFTLFLRRNC